MRYYSNGKLIILGEYYVLKGAKAFAVPTKFGQSLEAHPNKTSFLSWKSFDADNTIWYNDKLLISDIIRNNQTSKDKTRNTLIDILHQAHLMNPSLLTMGFTVETQLTFPRKWGLGTSSTLINNIAQWFEIESFELLQRSFGGSGYDIACAQYNFPITYQIINNQPVVEQVRFQPSFKEHIFFVYLNQKQDSKEAINNLRNKQKDLTHEVIHKVSTLTDKLLNTQDMAACIALLKRYEQDLSAVLNTPTIQEKLFADFDGLVKSLGAWGGDFVMAISKENPKAYFIDKGYEIILSFDEIIL